MLPYISVLTYRKLKLILSDQTVTSPSDDIIIPGFFFSFCVAIIGRVTSLVIVLRIMTRTTGPPVARALETLATATVITCLKHSMLRLKKVRQLSTTVSTLPRITVELISDTM